MPKETDRELLVPQTFANSPSRISVLNQLSHKKDVSVSELILDALDLYFEENPLKNGKRRFNSAFSQSIIALALAHARSKQTLAVNTTSDKLSVPGANDVTVM